MIPTVCFIACHGASADHFATFIEQSKPETVHILAYASVQMAKKFDDRKIPLDDRFSLEEATVQEEAKRIAIKCSSAAVVITDVGHQFSALMQKALAQYAPNTLRFAYYDNPECYVPGGYSAVAADVMLAANGVLFANANLAEMTLFQVPNVPIDLTTQKKIGIGYYPLQQVDAIIKRRMEEKQVLRQQIFSKHAFKDVGQKLLVYFGGNNEEYFTKAFPAFLSLIAKAMEQSDLSGFVFVHQSHPAAKTKNLDGAQITAWQNEYADKKHAPKIIISDFTSDAIQVVADGALYYQTSMGPQFVLAGIPTAQIGHETYADVLVRSRLIDSITNSEQLISTLHAFLHKNQNEVVILDSAVQDAKTTQSRIMQGLGITPNWAETVAQVYCLHV